MTQAVVLRFANDSAKRKRLFVAEAMAHPAKGHISLWEEMVLRYSQEGDWILDPMAGIGTSLIAALLGRNVVCVELESHFVEPMARSWEKMQQHPMLGYPVGQAVILRGDARALPLSSVDCVITSPPYEEGLGHQGSVQREILRTKSLHGGSRNYTELTRSVDAIVTSPPFQDQEATKAGKFSDPLQAAEIQSSNYRSGKSKGHFASPEAILRAMDSSKPYPRDNQQNIGNQRGTAYWESMHQVYAECWRVLKPGGVLALVLKGFTRDGKYVDLPGQTEALLLEAGWVKHDRWRRELWSLSFWRILQKRRDPAAFDERLNFEEVLAFRKPNGEGRGIDAVLTSPPYEGSLQGEPGIDFTRMEGGTRNRTEEPAFGNVKAAMSGYTKKPGKRS